MTQINVCIANKQMHDKHKDQLPLPQARWSKCKRTDKEQGKTKHEAPHSVNYRATQSKNNIRTTSERSVVYTTRGFKGLSPTNFTLGPDIILNTKNTHVHKKFGLHNGFLTQSMHLIENTKSNQLLWRNKDIASSPNPLVKALCRGCHWVWGPTHRQMY